MAIFYLLFTWIAASRLRVYIVIYVVPSLYNVSGLDKKFKIPLWQNKCSWQEAHNTIIIFLLSWLFNNIVYHRVLKTFNLKLKTWTVKYRYDRFKCFPINIIVVLVTAGTLSLAYCLVLLL